MEQGMNTYYSSQLNDAKAVKQVILDRIAAEEAERKKREEEEERQRQELARIEAKRLAQLAAAREKLRGVMNSRDINAINTVLQETIKNGMTMPEIEEARVLLDSLKKQSDVKSQLSAAIKVLESQAESGINRTDLSPLQQAIAAAEQVSLYSLLF
jgi:hypothetical protein